MQILNTNPHFFSSISFPSVFDSTDFSGILIPARHKLVRGSDDALELRVKRIRKVAKALQAVQLKYLATVRIIQG